MTRFHPSADQGVLASTIEKAIVSLLPQSRLHVSIEESETIWSGLEEIGIFGITAGEEQGGSGLGAVEETLITMALGRCLAAPTVFATLGAAHAMRDDGVRSVPGPRTAAGFRRSNRVVAVGDSGAEYLLIREPEKAGVYAVGQHASNPVDNKLWLTALHEYVSLGQPVAHFDATRLLRLRLLDAAALAGISQAALEMAVAYANARVQFGRPIGSYQAIKHHCANMAIAACCARDQANFAAVAIDDDREDAALQVESAFLVAGSAALENAAKNIQIHGGIGFSDEARPHLFLKRAQLLIAIGGGLESAVARVGNARGGW